MTMVTEPDDLKKYTAECTEPRCESFAIGHEQYEFERDDPSFLHQAAHYGDFYGEESYEIKIVRDPTPEAVWDLFIQVNGDMWTPAEATAFAGVLTKAATKCTMLNNVAHAEHYSRIVYDRLYAAAEQAGLADDPLFDQGPRSLTVDAIAELTKKCGVNVEDVFPRLEDLPPRA